MTAVTPPEPQFAHVRGVDLAYTVVGDGPTVVSAHGLSTSSWAMEQSGTVDWSPVSDAGFRLVRYDARGHGLSQGTLEASDYLWPALADDLLAFLDVVAPGEQVAGIGLSMGTATLLHAALKEPSRFSKLVLSAPPTAWATRAAQAGFYVQMAELVETSGLDALIQAMADAPRPAALEAESADQAAMTPQVSAELLPIVFRGAAQTDLPPLEELSAIEVPALLLPWAGDPGHPVATSEALLGVLPDARLEVAESVEDVHAFGARAAEFLRRGA